MATPSSSARTEYGSLEIETGIEPIPQEEEQRIFGFRRTAFMLLTFSTLVITGLVATNSFSSGIRHPTNDNNKDNLPHVMATPAYPTPAYPIPAFVNNASNGSVPTVPKLKPIVERNCTLDECHTFHCDPKMPYVCTEGFAKTGCSKSPAAFGNSPACSDFCSLAGCHSLEKPCGNCSETDCTRLAAVCGTKLHYACIDGAANGGCSDEADMWPNSREAGICLNCCDLSTCPTPAGCDDCTDAECLQVGSCAPDKPYACSAGPAVAGCAKTQEYWQSAEFKGVCTKCCDTTACHKAEEVKDDKDDTDDTKDDTTTDKDETAT